MAFRFSSKVAEMKLRDLHSKFPIRVPLAGAIPSSRLGVEKTDYAERVSEQQHSDGQPGFAGRPDRDIEKKVFPIGTRPESAFPFGGCVIDEAWKGEMLQAKKVYSRILGAELWLIFERTFEPQDNLGLYYLEEIILLWDKTPKALREIHKVKLAFPGCRVIQEGADR